MQTKQKKIENPQLREITRDEFMSLVNNDTVYLATGDIFCQSKVIGKPFFNHDADEPGWEVETSNGYSDMYSIYVEDKTDEPSDKARDWSLNGILKNYFHGGVLEHASSYNLLVSLVYDLEALGVLHDANGVITRLDEIDSGREY